MPRLGPGLPQNHGTIVQLATLRYPAQVRHCRIASHSQALGRRFRQLWRSDAWSLL